MIKRSGAPPAPPATLFVLSWAAGGLSGDLCPPYFSDLNHHLSQLPAHTELLDSKYEKFVFWNIIHYILPLNFHLANIVQLLFNLLCLFFVY